MNGWLSNKRLVNPAKSFRVSIASPELATLVSALVRLYSAFKEGIGAGRAGRPCRSRKSLNDGFDALDALFVADSGKS